MTEEIEVVEERHFLGTLIRLAVFIGVIYALGRLVARQKDEYAGLTESEARSKFMAKVGPKLGEETAQEIADQVIPKLKERGLIKPDPTEDSKDDDPVAEAVDTVVED